MPVFWYYPQNWKRNENNDPKTKIHLVLPKEGFPYASYMKW